MYIVYSKPDTHNKKDVLQVKKKIKANLMPQDLCTDKNIIIITLNFLCNVLICRYENALCCFHEHQWDGLVRGKVGFLIKYAVDSNRYTDLRHLSSFSLQVGFKIEIPQIWNRRIYSSLYQVHCL